MLIRWQKTIVDQRGNVQPGAVLTIRRMSDQAIVTVYRDREGIQAYPTGAVTADENGYAYFYASPGLYRITSIQPAIDWPDESLAATFVTVGGGPYQTVAEGLSSTSDGEYFFVSPSSQAGGLYDLYLNHGENAELIGVAPSLEGINSLFSQAISRANEAIQLGYQSMGISRTPTEGNEGWISSEVDKNGNIIAGIDGLGRSRGAQVPDDEFVRYPTEGLAEKESFDTLNPAGQVINRYDSRGQLRADMSPDDQVRRYPTEGMVDDQALSTPNPRGEVLSYFDQSGRLRGVFVPDDSVFRYPTEGFDDFHEFVEVDALGRIFAVYPQEEGSGLPPLGPSAGPYFEINAANMSVFWSWRAGPDTMIRLRWQPNGYNSLFNYRGRDRATGTDPAQAAWVQRHQTSSDCIAPKIIEAAVGDDAPFGPIYTGGNHGSSGGDGGDKTARMVSWQVTIDGRVLGPGEVFTGYARNVEVEWLNELMAFNTISDPATRRYVWRQQVKGRCVPGGIEVIESDYAMSGETVTMRMDNFTQSFIGGAGYDEWGHFYDGQQGGRFPYVVGQQDTSGTKDYPSWAAVFTGPDGIHAVWGDRNYEAGDGRYLFGTVGFFRLNNNKLYSNIVGGAGVYQTFSDGAGYSMRGGYSFGLSEDAIDIDSAFMMPKREQMYLAYALTSAGSGRARVPQFYVDRSATGGHLIGPSGVAVSASGYETNSLPIEVLQ